MPKYRVDINRLVEKEEVALMVSYTKKRRDRFVIAMLYITGARPTEILKMKEGAIIEKDDKIRITLPTLKLNKLRFVIQERTLEFDRDTPFINYVMDYKDRLPMKTISLRRIEQIVEKLSDGMFCPYNFRHSRFTKLARQGMTVDELMYWKGSQTTDSVSDYLRAKPIERKYKIV